jgi:hypothetical protein
VASLTALARTVLSTPGGTPVMPLLVSWSSDSAGVMYQARRPFDGVAGYHRETISSRALTPAAQGSGREVSVSLKDVVPTGHGPVGSGRHGVCPCSASASPASAGVPMPPIITGRPLPAPSENPHVRAGVTHTAPGAAAVRQRLGTVSSTWAWLPGFSPASTRASVP